MNIEKLIADAAAEAARDLYGVEDASLVQVQKTRKEFEGDFTLVVFPLLKSSRKSPEATANEIGERLVATNSAIGSFNVIKGFLNISLKPEFWGERFAEIAGDATFGKGAPTGRTVMVEYSSPNTNKPLHLGHIRNNLLGYSVAEILKECGNKVLKVNLVNDRGIHICKSMLAWQKFGGGETPASSGLKGDHLVGKYYVIFNNKFKEQASKLSQNFKTARPNSTLLKEEMISKVLLEEILSDIFNKINYENDYETDYIGAVRVTSKIVDSYNFEKWKLDDRQIKEIKKYIKSRVKEQLKTSLIGKAQNMLRRWEARDPEVYGLWERMNGWVYEGFDVTYKRLGVDFDKIYYESQTYLLGKSLVEEGLAKGVFYRRPDGSVWIDLTVDGLDEKLLLRADGTSVYMTQDLGTAYRRFEEENLDALIYVVGNEQNYHFQVLKLVLKKLGYEWSDAIYHLSYGMVELPEGKMKSREGTVVDADDLIEGMVEEARTMSQELGKLDGATEAEAAEIANMVGLGALKYFILKVDPRKTMLFDPRESIDFNGNTGPFIQYTHARIRSVLRKATEAGIDYTGAPAPEAYLPEEIELIKTLAEYPSVVASAGESFSPAVVAAYAYDLAKMYNGYYHDHSIMREQDATTRAFRLALSAQVAAVIRRSMHLLGIAVPERM
jgi:arginyl-tRNA synthetase